jgi:hypothetical protein
MSPLLVELLKANQLQIAMTTQAKTLLSQVETLVCLVV